jgi:hypothetical protein
MKGLQASLDRLPLLIRLYLQPNTHSHSTLEPVEEIEVTREEQNTALPEWKTWVGYLWFDDASIRQLFLSKHAYVQRDSFSSIMYDSLSRGTSD